MTDSRAQEPACGEAAQGFGFSLSVAKMRDVGATADAPVLGQASEEFHA